MKKYLTLLVVAVIFLAVGCEDEEKNIAVTGVTIDPPAVTVGIGALTAVTAEVQPTNATNQEVTWVSNSAVATVSGGTITGVAEGAATITATTIDGRHTAKVAVMVVEIVIPVEEVTVDITEVSLNVSESTTVTATVRPADATNPGVRWETNAPEVATVVNGVITGVADGPATITVITMDGGHTATVAVTVTTSGFIRLWAKTAADIGLSLHDENSIAVCGNYVVVSRTGICINKADGSVASGKTLNVTNIPRGGTPANQIPAFYLFNDSEGNMLGATIPVLAGVFNIYKWTSVDDDPILLYSGTSSNGDARKMAAVGDINGHAFIYDLITDSPTGDYRQWEVIGGAIQPVNTFTTNVPAFSFQHIIAPLHVTADPAFFCVSRLLNGAGGPSVNVLYKNETGTLSEIQPSAPHQYNGSGTYTYYGGKEWGGLGTSACTAFWFDGQAYGVILTQSWYASIVSIIDATPAHNYLLVDIVDDYTRDESERDNYIRIDNFNGNLTAGTCYEIAPDGKTVWVYTLFTGESVKCYKMTI